MLEASRCAPSSLHPASPETFVAFTREQRVKWGEVMKAAGVKIE